MKKEIPEDRLVKGKFVIFKGKKFYPPYKCLCCGVEVLERQFCFGRACGYCDTGSCYGKIGHNRKDIFENAEEIGDDFQELVKEKLEIIKDENKIYKI